MRKAFGLWTVALLVLWSCQIQTVNIKAKPTVALPAGTLSVEVGKTLTDAIKEGAGADSPMTVTEDANGNIALVLDQKILDLPLSDVFDSGAVDLGNLAADIPETKLDIPSFAGATVAMPFAINNPARLLAPPISNRVELQMNAGSTFRGGQIKTGSLNISAPLPAGATITQITITLFQPDPSGNPKQIYTSTAASSTPSFNLSGVELGAGNITIDYRIEVDVDPLVFTGPAQVAAEASLSVSAFHWVKFLAADLDLTETINTPFTSDQRQFLDWVKIKNPAGISLDFTNGLPSAMTFTVSSNILGIASSTLTVPAKTATGPSQASRNFSATKFDIDVDGLDGSGNPLGFDLTFEVGLAGYDKATKILQLDNVVPGESYSYKGKIDVNIVPVEAAIKNLGATPLKGSFPGLPVDGVSKILPPELEFASVPYGLTISGIPGLNGTLVLNAKYKDAADLDQTISVLDGTSGQFVTDATGAPTKTIAGNMKDVLNLRTSNPVGLEYQLTLGGATIELDPAVKKNFAAQLRLEIPFILTVKETAAARDIGATKKYVPFKLQDPDPLDFSTADKKDLFGRTDTSSEINDVIEGLTEATLNLGSVNTTGLGLALGITYGADPNKVQKYLFIEQSGVSTLTLNAADLALWKTIPFKPKMELLVPVGDLSIKAAGKLDLTVSLQAKSDVDLDIAVKDGNK